MFGCLPCVWCDQTTLQPIEGGGLGLGDVQAEVEVQGPGGRRVGLSKGGEALNGALVGALGLNWTALQDKVQDTAVSGSTAMR